MNRQTLQDYIAEYKLDFTRVSQDEIYKWKAVKCFQDEWYVDADDFYSMLSDSLKLTQNLLASGQYFPLRMLLLYSKQKPNEVRDLFKNLFDEEVDLFSRIEEFQKGIDAINDEIYLNKKSYQDHRAVLVYLSLRYPERYFFYKFGMFAAYSRKLELIYTPVKGRIENIGQFNSQCQIIRRELSLDQELLKLHKNRIQNDCYYDENLNILTQDFIYFVSRNSLANQGENTSSITKLSVIETLATSISTLPSKVNFQGRTLNYIQNEIENKYLGDLGEDWVLKYEIEKLERANKHHLIKLINHSARNDGDGTGYDIQSFDEGGNEILIEVKTTKGSRNSTIYLSRNELERSKIDSERYYLYRLYNFNEKTDTAELLIIKGDLTSLCANPATYKIRLNEIEDL